MTHVTSLGETGVPLGSQVYARHLSERGLPKGVPGRIALPVAGDDAAAKAVVLKLVDAMGFDAVDAGGLDESWRQQPGSPVYAKDFDAAGVRAALATAHEERTPKWPSSSPGAFTAPAWRSRGPRFGPVCLAPGANSEPIPDCRSSCWKSFSTVRSRRENLQRAAFVHKPPVSLGEEPTVSEEQKHNLRDLVAEVAAAYFANSHVSVAEIGTVVEQIAKSLGAVGETTPPVASPEGEASTTRRLTSAQIRRSITPDALISFEDGRSYKTLRRHLSVKGLTPVEYRQKWGLPKDYPMVAASYSASRSQLAKALGLGNRRQVAPDTAPRRGRKAASTPG